MPHTHLKRSQVKILQKQLNERLAARHQATIVVDGEYGPHTAAAVAEVKYLLGFPKKSLHSGPNAWFRIVLNDPARRTTPYIVRARARAKRLARRPLRLKAYKAAKALVGVMEIGGNNIGPVVTKIIRANGGTGPEPWCGDFQAFVYRIAGSKSVTRAWAAVALYLGVAGVRQTRTPLRGDLVRYTFSHIGMFVCDNGNGTITTIEGNTGRSGAVSDSSTGGDGVYIKVRPKYLVRDYLHVTR